jgi:hypothetical protein
MSLNFNVDPYYDDFDAAKNFHRILFKPGFAVQARELTQSQTILQDQISKFGNGIYRDGSKVSGANITYDSNVVTGKLLSTSVDDIESYIGLFVVGATSGFVSKVIDVNIENFYIITKPVNVSNGQSFTSGETLNFFNTKTDALSSLKATVSPVYTSTLLTETTVTKTGVSGTYLQNKLSGSNIASGISVGDKIVISSQSNLTAIVIKIIDADNILISKNLIANLSSQNISVTSVASNRAMQISVDEGVWFTNGFFVRNDASSIVPDELNAFPSAIIGFEVNENIIDSFNDSSLLDPAIAASNYQAPGADRYKISFTIVSRPYVSDQTISNLTTEKFIELVRVNNGVIENLNNTPVYSEISKYIQQGIYDQSGDFIVNPFKLLINDSFSSESNFPASISAGKAYIYGKPVERIAPTNYKIEKSRDTTSLSEQLISTYYGNYVECRDIRGSFVNFKNGTQVELHKASYGAANANTIIGTAAVFNFDYDSGTANNTIYKVFLSEIALSNNAFANVSSLIIPGGSNNYTTVSFSANTVSPTTLNDELYDDLLFVMPQENLANITNADYITRRYYSAPSFVSGVFTINTSGPDEIFVGGSGSISSAERRQNYGVVVTSSSGNYTAGTFIPMDQANVTITINNSGTPQATINIGGNFSGSATIFATISSTNAQLKNKVLNTNGYSLVSANTLNETIELGYADIYQFKGVYELGNTISFMNTWSGSNTYSNTQSVIYNGKVYKSLTNSNLNNTPDTSLTNWIQLQNSLNNYVFDNGQKDNMYDHGTIRNISGVAKGNVVAVFDYFTHSGGLGYMTLNSYPVDYASIPTFTSKKYGVTRQLRDCLDFRPRRSDGVGTKIFDNFEIPAPFEDVYVDYAYYLSRVDKIVLYPNGQFRTLRGISSYENPVPPADIPGALTLFKLDIPAYTFTAKDVVNTPTVLRRYTMRDIGLLDKRISNLEYYTSLSILENEVSGMDVTDSTGQNLLFKNGFLVDGFTGSSVADVVNPDYAASIDKLEQLARPLFNSTIANYTVDTNQGTFKLTTGRENNKIFLSNNIITFSYTEVPLVFQNVASQIVKVNPFDVATFIGDASISPGSDIWYDTQSKPIINIVNQDQSAWIAAVNQTGNGSQWNDWQINWTGQSTDSIVNSGDTAQVTRNTQAIADVIASRGLQAAVSGGPIQVSSTQKVLSSEIVNVARSKKIQFNLRGLAPFTQINTFINGNQVNRYVRPTTPTGVYKVDITGAGTGYTNGNNQSIITVVGDCQVQAQLTANVSGGQIVSVQIVNPGFGYTSTPTIRVTGSNTSTAILTSNTTAYGSGVPLVTDINGFASGELTLPNDSFLKFPTGALSLEWSDSLLNPATSKSYARATFYSQGTLEVVETTVVSTRPPIIKPKPQTPVRPIDPPAPIIDETPVVVNNPSPTPSYDPLIIASLEAYDDGSNITKFILALSPTFIANNPGTYSWRVEQSMTNYADLSTKLNAVSGSLTAGSPSTTLSLTTPHPSGTLRIRISRSGFTDWVNEVGVNSRSSSAARLDSPLEVFGSPVTSIIQTVGTATTGTITVRNLSGSSVTVTPQLIERPTLAPDGRIWPASQTIIPYGSVSFGFSVSSPLQADVAFAWGFLADGYTGSYPTFRVEQLYRPAVATPLTVTETTDTTTTSNTTNTTTNVGGVEIITTNTTIDTTTTTNTTIDTSNTVFVSGGGTITTDIFDYATGTLNIIELVSSLTLSRIPQIDDNGADVIQNFGTTLVQELYDTLTSSIGNVPTFNDYAASADYYANMSLVYGSATAMNMLNTEINNSALNTLTDGSTSYSAGGIKLSDQLNDSTSLV